ncbi:apolipoprotein N-acyltransferase [Thermotoga sp. KOL6]|uniref:apolipoprotein N-acyltransferase n=1 Tax=Thermotoga sp. KOL6 TaxID=126741 RepID=UPI000CAC2372|nr:apolipoprotein N-acyltransferase [Thermotoga sp. KOL6]PLV59288.1 acyltransferase [Thermotoga sp. KOL6]
MVDLCFSVLSGILTALSMPGFLSGSLIWFSLVPLFWVMEKTGIWKRTLLSFVYFLTHISISFFWVLPTLTENLPVVFGRYPGWLGIVVFLLMGGIEALPFLGFGFLSYFSPQRGIFLKSIYLASIYTVFEYIRGLGELGFTGGRISEALFKQLGFVQIVSVTGTLGLVFLIVFVNSLFYELLKKRKHSFIFVVLTIIYIFNSTVMHLLPIPEQGDFKILALQPNVPSSLKYFTSSRDIAKLLEKMVEDERGQICITPEAFFLEDVRYSSVANKLREISEKNSFVLGFPANRRNSVFLLENGTFKELYSKIKLFPFVETLPYPKIFGVFSFLKGFAYYEPGDEFSVFSIRESPPFSIQICFESYFPQVSRAFVKNGSEFLVVVTNDGWFHYRVALLNHFAQGIFRAVETRRQFLQVANTGFTGLVDEYGRIIAVLSPGERKVGTFYITPRKGKTLYVRFGDWFFYFAILLAGVSFLMSKM